MDVCSSFSSVRQFAVMLVGFFVGLAARGMDHGWIVGDDQDRY